MATTLETLVRDFIGQMAHGAPDQTEARELLARLDAKPARRAPAMQFAQPKKGRGRKGAKK